MDYNNLIYIYPCYGCRERICGEDAKELVRITALSSMSILREEKDFYTHNNPKCINKAKEKIEIEFGEMGLGVLEKIVVKR